MKIILAQDWLPILKTELKANYYKNIISFLEQEVQAGKTIYPEIKNIFKAFELCTWQNVQVVILGQDPYHGAAQAHGLSFSVADNIKLPPSLKNIFKELLSDLNITPSTNGNLTAWAQQGVLLLNTYLTVTENTPLSHSKIGWETFTDAVIKIISGQKEHVVFILWGAFAQKKEILIDAQKHCIIKSAHPSPLSAHNGFWGSKCFSATNNYLAIHDKKPINWKL
jgi:uracil-DNA glycosylase